MGIQKRVIACVTLFFSNALTIDCAPPSPILFESRQSDMSVYI